MSQMPAGEYNGAEAAWALLDIQNLRSVFTPSHAAPSPVPLDPRPSGSTAQHAPERDAALCFHSCPVHRPTPPYMYLPCPFRLNYYPTYDTFAYPNLQTQAPQPARPWHLPLSSARDTSPPLPTAGTSSTPTKPTWGNALPSPPSSPIFNRISPFANLPPTRSPSSRAPPSPPYPPPHDLDSESDAPSWSSTRALPPSTVGREPLSPASFASAGPSMSAGPTLLSTEATLFELPMPATLHEAMEDSSTLLPASVEPAPSSPFTPAPSRPATPVPAMLPSPAPSSPLSSPPCSPQPSKDESGRAVHLNIPELPVPEQPELEITRAITRSRSGAERKAPDPRLYERRKSARLASRSFSSR